MSKYETVTVDGYWEDDKENPRTGYLVALGDWDGEEDDEEDDEDDSIFFYLDGAPLKVGDVIAGGFVVTAIDTDD
jgi:hypothetical protein